MQKKYISISIVVLAILVTWLSFSYKAGDSNPEGLSINTEFQGIERCPTCGGSVKRGSISVSFTDREKKGDYPLTISLKSSNNVTISSNTVESEEIDDGSENVILFFYPTYDNIESTNLIVEGSDNIVLFRKEYNLLDLIQKG